MAFSACAMSQVDSSAALSERGAEQRLAALIPKPVHVLDGVGVFVLDGYTAISVRTDIAGAGSVRNLLVQTVARATGVELPVEPGSPASPVIEFISATTGETKSDEGYFLTISPRRVTIAASAEAGFFYATQTLLQLLPPQFHSVQPHPDSIQSWPIAAAEIADRPRYPWRGYMLDVARHFFSAEEVKRLIDQIAQYKLNVLHLHLTDDQGWRIEIKSRPALTTVGGSTAVGGGAGGFYTQEQYKELVAYAAARQVDVIAEIDMPGHTGAALSSIAELNCDDVAPPLYTGVKVGQTALCVDKAATYEFLRDILTEIAQLGRTGYIHIGGDEARPLTSDQYTRFITQAVEVVHSLGMRSIGWEEVASRAPGTGDLIQHWIGEVAATDIADHQRVIVSDARHAYLDMKEDLSQPIGAIWFGAVSAERAYDWDPENSIAGLSPKQIIGIEAAMWTETVPTFSDVEYLTYPRLIGLAEIGWSLRADRNWEEYRLRLAAHAPILDAQMIGFFRSDLIDWP